MREEEEWGPVVGERGGGKAGLRQERITEMGSSLFPFSFELFLKAAFRVLQFLLRFLIF